MRKILSFLNGYRFIVFAAIMFTMVELMVELLQPYIISKIIDDGIGQDKLSVVLGWGGVLAGCSILALAAGLLSSFYAAHVSQSFGFDVRERLYSKVQSFSFSEYGRFSESSLITRLTSDVMQLQNTVFMGLRIMLRAPLLIVGSVVMAFIVQPVLAIWLAGAIPFICLFLAWVMREGERMFRAVQQQLDKVNSVMQQNLIGMRMVRAFVRMRHESERFGGVSAGLMDKTMSALKLTEATMPVVLLLMNAGIIGVLWFGRLEIDTGDATVGQIVALINYATRMTGALSILSMIIVNLSRARASAQRVVEVLETDGSTARTVDGAERYEKKPEEGAVSFDRISFAYPDMEDNVLTGISFAASPGDTVAILGATGSGKSSLLQLIPRLYDAKDGTIDVDDVSIDRYRTERLREQIGYVPQDIVLFTGSVADNIRWGKEDATMEEVMTAAKRARIHDTIMHLPEQYATIVGQKGVNLSGGQKQRLTIARALVRNPLILLLDDSTSALDIQTEAALLNEIKAMNCTTFLVTQKISSARSADRIILLDDGRMLAGGTHAELLAASELYRKICESQAGKEDALHAG